MLMLLTNLSDANFYFRFDPSSFMRPFDISLRYWLLALLGCLCLDQDLVELFWPLTITQSFKRRFVLFF